MKIEKKLDIKIDKNIKLYKVYLLKQLKQNKTPYFFDQKLKVSPEIKKEFEKHFSKNNYPETSAGHFEMWPIITLLRHSMEIGYRLGKNKKAVYKIQKKSSELLKKLDKFDFVLKKKDISHHINWDRIIKVVIQNSGTPHEKIILYKKNITDDSKVDIQELNSMFKEKDLIDTLKQYHKSIYQLMKKDKWKR